MVSSLFQAGLLEDAVQGSWGNFDAAFARYGDCAGPGSVMELPVAALLAELIPAISFETRDQFLDLRRHRSEIVLFLLGGSLLQGVLIVGSSLGLPELAFPVRTEVLGPLTGDGDLIGSLVGHVEFVA